ncbi:hypothetical protein ACFPA8_24910 [Streptomyces ovatisporus]|uniref:Uncharacterized protein n=1 Tax=Streptomyces ovatisporus TaxID=1128682 RepID=A0ABV9AES3_9ACTN
MTTAIQSRSPMESALLGEELSLPLEAPLWLLAGVDDEEEPGFEPHIWRGID